LSSPCLKNQGWEISHEREICGQIGINESSANETTVMTMEHTITMRLSRSR
jgi:hypothetical protein